MQRFLLVTDMDRVENPRVCIHFLRVQQFAKGIVKDSA
jgi:hypothetical protein